MRLQNNSRRLPHTLFHRARLGGSENQKKSQKYKHQTSTRTFNMKLITKFAVLGILTSFGITAAFADDPQLQNRLNSQRTQNVETAKTPTTALYSNGQGVGRTTAMQDQRTDVRFEIRTNAHGQTFNTYAPA